MFGSRAKPGRRGGIYGMGLGISREALQQHYANSGVIPAPPSTMIVGTVDPNVLASQANVASSGIPPIVIIGALGIGGFLLYKHFKKG